LESIHSQDARETRVGDELNAIGRRSVKLIGCRLLDTKKMRIAAAGLDEILKRFGAG